MSSSGGDQMPKLNVADDASHLSSAQKKYMRILEQQNAERANKIMRMRRNNKFVGSCLGLGALAIYSYSIYSVKQEKFLDELEELDE